MSCSAWYLANVGFCVGDLKLDNRLRHNLGPTWYGDAETMITMANATIAVMHHIITKEFEQLPGGGIKQQFLKGEGWPEWSAGIAAMYATEIVANHMLAEFESSTKYDEHGDSPKPVSEVCMLHSCMGACSRSTGICMHMCMGYPICFRFWCAWRISKSVHVAVHLFF